MKKNIRHIPVRRSIVTDTFPQLATYRRFPSAIIAENMNKKSKHFTNKSLT